MNVFNIVDIHTPLAYISEPICISLKLASSLAKLQPYRGGLRKVRWSMSGRGKRGGVRAIYYWTVDVDQILMLFMYAKNEKDDLTPQQLRVLRDIVEKEFR